MNCCQYLSPHKWDHAEVSGADHVGSVFKLSAQGACHCEDIGILDEAVYRDFIRAKFND